MAGIPRLAECEAGSVVGSPHGWFSVGALPVDIYVVGVIGSKIVSGEYVKAPDREYGSWVGILGVSSFPIVFLVRNAILRSVRLKRFVM